MDHYFVCGHFRLPEHVPVVLEIERQLSIEIAERLMTIHADRGSSRNPSFRGYRAFPSDGGKTLQVPFYMARGFIRSAVEYVLALKDETGCVVASFGQLEVFSREQLVAMLDEHDPK